MQHVDAVGITCYRCVPLLAACMLLAATRLLPKFGSSFHFLLLHWGYRCIAARERRALSKRLWEGRVLVTFVLLLVCYLVTYDIVIVTIGATANDEQNNDDDNNNGI